MAVTHSIAVQNAATDAAIEQLGASPVFRFRATGTLSSPGAVIAELPMSETPFGLSVNGLATANVITSDSNTAAGTVATASIDTSGDSVQIHCAVAASGSDVNVTGGLVFEAGDTMSLLSLTYRALVA